MLDYVLPVLACLATIVAILAQKRNVSFIKQRSNIGLLAIALLTLAVSEWLTYEDNVTSRERQQKIERISSQLSRAQEQRGVALEQLELARTERARLENRQEQLRATLEDAREQRSDALDKLLAAREEIGRLQVSLDKTSHDQLIRGKVARCEAELSQRRDFALFVGLFRNGYTEHRLDVPTDHDIRIFDRLMARGEYKGTTDEAMMTAVGDWPSHRFPRASISLRPFTPWRRISRTWDAN